MRRSRRHRRAAIVGGIAIVVYLLAAGSLAKLAEARPRVIFRAPEQTEVEVFFPVVAFSSDSRHFATIAFDEHQCGPIRIRDTATGREVASFLSKRDKLLRDLLYGRIGVEFSPDGRRLVVLLKKPIWGEPETTLKIFDLEGSREIASLPVRAPMESGFECRHPICMSPDGRWLAVPCNDSQHAKQVLRLIDLAIGKEGAQAAVSGLPADLDSAFDFMTFAPDGKALAFQIVEFGEEKAKWLIVWDIESQRERFRILADCYSVAFSPDSRKVAFCGARDDLPYVRICDAHTGEHLVELTQDKDRLSSLAVSPDGRYFAAGIAGGGYGVWSESFDRIVVGEMATGRLLRTLESASTPDRAVMLENPLDSCLPQFVLKSDTIYRELQPGDSRYSILNLATGAEPLVIQCQTGTGEYLWQCYGMSSDGRFFADSGCQYGQPNQLHQWIGELIPQWAPPVETKRRMIRLWDVATGQPLPSLYDCKGGFLFSPDGKTLAVGGEDGTPQLWDLPPRKPLGLILAWACVPAMLVLLLGWWRGRRRLH